MNNNANIPLVEEIVDEYFRRQRRGENPSLAEYTDRHPELADDIRDFVEALQLVERYKRESISGLTLDQEVHRGAAGGFPDIKEYHIIRELGHGGMGVVYEARHVTLDRRVALKLLPIGRSHNDIAVKRFLREARSAAALHHTNIVPVFDVGSCGNVHYYAMQLIQGSPLNDVIQEIKKIREADTKHTDSKKKSTEIAHSIVYPSKAPLAKDRDLATRVELDHDVDADHEIDDDRSFLVAQSAQASDTDPGPDIETIRIAEATRDTTSITGVSNRHYYRKIAEIALQVAEALKYAHTHGIIHRDIKPANLILDHDANVWVADFGLAKLEDEELTSTGDVVGTLRYMSPERFHGECDSRSDVYSLGITLYELLALKPAFTANSQASLLEKIQNDEPAALRSLDRRIPLDLETIVNKAIEKEPTRRYSSARQLGEDLRRFINGQPIKARRVTLLERWLLWSRKNRAIASMLAVMVLGLLAVTVASIITAISYRNLAETANTQAEIAWSINEFFNGDILGTANPLEGNIDQNTTLLAVLDEAAERIDDRFQDKPVVEARIRRTIGEAYLALGQFDKAHVHLEFSRDILSAALGDDDPDTIESELQLAKYYRDSRKSLPTAKAMLEHVTEYRVRQLGPDAPETLESLHEFADLLAHSDEFGRAIELMEGVWKTRQRTLGDNHRDTIRSLIRLGQYHLNTDQEKAKPLLVQAVDVAESVLGDEDMLTMTARQNMADFYTQQRTVELGIQLIQKNLAASEQWLGENHPYSISTLETLCVQYEHAKNLEDYLATAKEIIRRSEITYGEKSDKAMDQRESLGVVYKAVGQYPEARTEYDKVRSYRVAKYGEDHKSVAWSDYLLGNLDVSEAKYDDARNRITRAYDFYVTNVGEDDPDTILVMWGLINYYMSTKQFALGLPLMEKGLEHRIKQYGRNSTPVVSVMQHLFFCQINLKKYEAAENNIRECIDILREMEHQGIVQQVELYTCIIKLAVCLNMQEKYEEANREVQAAVDFTGWPDGSRWKQARAQGVQGEALTHLGRFDEAESLLNDASHGFETLTDHLDVGVRHSYQLKMARRYVALFEQLDRQDELQQWNERLAILEEVLESRLSK